MTLLEYYGVKIIADYVLVSNEEEDYELIAKYIKGSLPYGAFIMVTTEREYIPGLLQKFYSYEIKYANNYMGILLNMDELNYNSTTVILK